MQRRNRSAHAALKRSVLYSSTSVAAWSSGDTRKVEHGRRERPVDELDLRECRMRERAVRREIVDELLEREFLVQQRIHGGVPDPAEQPGEGRIVS
jgi:hypothetical protein